MSRTNPLDRCYCKKCDLSCNVFEMIDHIREVHDPDFLKTVPAQIPGFVVIPDSIMKHKDNPFSKTDPRGMNPGVEKCPHGVMKGITCAICDPEKFKKETGIG